MGLFIFLISHMLFDKPYWYVYWVFLLSHFSVSLLLLLVDWLVVATGYYYLVSILIFELWSVIFFLFKYQKPKPMLFFPLLLKMLICCKYGIWETRNAPFQFLFRSLFILHQSCLFWLKINCVGWCGHTKNFSKKSDCVSFLNYKIDFFFFPLKTKTSPATFLYATVWNYRL